MGQKKFIKSEMKNGRSKAENKQKLKQGFPKSFERCKEGRLEILIVGIFTIHYFCHFEDEIQ